MLRTSSTLVFVVLALTASLAAQRDDSSGGPLSTEQAAYDVLHYDLALKVDPETRTIEGALEVTVMVVAAALSELVLDLTEELTVKAVSSLDVALPHRHAEGKLRVQLKKPAKKGDTVCVRVAYGGKPRVAPNPPWSGGFTWSKTESGQPWIATSCQFDGADIWWPCKDHPSDEPKSMDLHITVPKPLVVASNGRLKEVTDAEEGWHTYHWHVSTPINNYGVALNIGPYVVVESSLKSVAGDTFPVKFWVLPENEEKAKNLMPEILDHLRFFEKHFGPYAFRGDKYGVVETPHLGMEHQSIIAYGYRYRRDQNDYDWLHHHELSHEWWGNLVTAPDWNDFWIHEGVGTYTQALYVEELRGMKAYHDVMRRNRLTIANRAPIAPREPTSMAGVRKGGGNEAYYKGAWILHTLRFLIGKDALMKSLRKMTYPDPALEKVTDGSACHFATTEDLARFASEVSGQDLKWFFEAYCRQAELPRLVQETKDGALHLRWEVQNDLPFPMPVEVLIGDKLVRVEMPEGNGTVSVPDDKKVTVDPERWLLRAVRDRDARGRR